MSFELNARSKKRLVGVHPDLVRVVELASTLVEDGLEFVVTEGLRTPERQAELFKAGKSQTMTSRHLTGHAVDLAAVVAGGISWDMKFYKSLAKAMEAASVQLDVPVTWGGNWVSLVDGPHFQLTTNRYP